MTPHARKSLSDENEAQDVGGDASPPPAQVAKIAQTPAQA